MAPGTSIFYPVKRYQKDPEFYKAYMRNYYATHEAQCVANWQRALERYYRMKNGKQNLETSQVVLTS